MSNPSDPVMSFIVNRPAMPPDEPSYVNSFYQAIGRFLLAWGSMEQHLDALARMAINIEADSSGAEDRIFMVNLGKKLDNLKVVCRDCVALNSFEDHVRRLSPIIKEMGADRDLLIHSSLREFEDDPPARIVLTHLEHPKGKNLTVETGRFSLEQLDSLTRKTQDLHHQLIFPLLQEMSELQDSGKLKTAQEQAEAADDHHTPIRL